MLGHTVSGAVLAAKRPGFAAMLHGLTKGRRCVSTRLTFVDDNDEAMTSFEHEEVYKAAREL